MENKKRRKEEKVEGRLGTEKWRRREGKRRKNGAGKGRKREKKIARNEILFYLHSK